ncbi:hypothetical protein WICMUC_003858 [Wickerhamomyces mucosus]|uniref:Mitochondrial genome maintenance protein MGM101 n=1 Tax=Wickerhamomyces mucosus TaxID=1378264 RepID=A0A9P8TC09_9ASCO|nr:hypothetical protein WICMUC_003858 [Wickerhamomyces mucosus]
MFKSIPSKLYNSQIIPNRLYAIYSKKPIIRTTSPIKRTITPSKTSSSTPSSNSNSNSIPIPEESFDPTEFNLQVGQSTRSKDESISSSPSSSSTSALSGLKSQKLNDIFTSTLHDAPNPLNSQLKEINWPISFLGLGSEPFNGKIQEILSSSIDPKDIEIKPDGLIYLPEIKYRRILNRAFGAGGWGLVPRSETIVTNSLITREYGLICNGRLISIARGEQDYFNSDGIPTATEGCKSNALMRCCKDLGIASELWDPIFIREFKLKYSEEKFVEHVSTKRKRKIWKRKDRNVEYPYKLS